MCTLCSPIRTVISSVRVRVLLHHLSKRCVWDFFFAATRTRAAVCRENEQKSDIALGVHPHVCVCVCKHNNLTNPVSLRSVCVCVCMCG